jgi:hypothetical protein
MIKNVRSIQIHFRTSSLPVKVLAMFLILRKREQSSLPSFQIILQKSQL